MSDRLISADKAKEVLKHLLYETAMNNLDIADIYEDIAEKRLNTWIELIPTADAVKHGHWIFRPDNSEGICSCCHYPIYGKPYNGHYLIVPYNYCPNCGAKMDEHIDTPTDPVAK